MIRLENVSMIFNQGTLDEATALQGIDLTVREKDFITINF